MSSAALLLCAAGGCRDAGATSAPRDGGAIQDGGAGLVADGAAGTATLVDGAGFTQAFEARSALAGLSQGYIFAKSVLATTHTMVALEDYGSACGAPSQDGRSVLIDIFDDANRPDSRPTSPGVFPAWLPPLQGFDAIPTGKMSIVTYIARNGGGELRVAQAGEVVVNAVSAGRIAGSFEATFSDGMLLGTFDVPMCEAWSRGSSVP